MKDQSETMLVLDGLIAGYGKLAVLHGVSLTVRRGSITTVIGPNGAGKTTLVKAIVGIVDIMKGSVVFDGTEISEMPVHKISGAGVGFVPQSESVFPTLTVQENLEMGCNFVPDNQRGAAISEAYTRFPRLKERRQQKARTLSGGERQMLAIASALLSNPELLILDEPVTGLSPQLTDEVIRGIREINQRGVTVLWVVEENPLQVLSIADWVYVMENGRVKTSEPAAQLLAAPDFRQIFLGI